MADFDTSRLEETKQQVMDYLADKRTQLPRPYLMAQVIEAQQLEITNLRAELASRPTNC